MLELDQIAAAAARLDVAHQARQPIRQLSREFPGMTIADAYAIQKAWVDQQLVRGRRIMGHKIGLTSRAMQKISGIEEPDYGVLLDDMLYEFGAHIPIDRFIAPRVEVELAFRLGADLEGRDVNVFDVLDATDYVIPAFEILDSRLQMTDPESGETRKITDTISDNAANAALVIGNRPMRPKEFDLRWVAALCYRNSEIEESGVAAAVLGHPASGLAWLARKLAPHGSGLKKGQIILSGSFIRPVHGRKGDTFLADFGPYGGVVFQFT